MPTLRVGRILRPAISCASCGHKQKSLPLLGSPARNAFSSTSTLSTYKKLPTSNRPLLPPPSVLYSNHHLVVVNKPAGWHSTPNPTGTNRKCMLTDLRRRRLGGGSQSDFLRPVHRLDQPCTGVILLAKTSKAASRAGKAWAKGEVRKEYYCVVEAKSIKDMQARSVPRRELGAGTDRGTKAWESEADTWWEDGESYVLTGAIKKGNNGGRGSVTVTQMDMATDQKRFGRECHLDWRHLESLSPSNLHLVAVRTNTGARHQVRALLSGIGGCPVAGDVRYGASSPLPDLSVALHARRLYLPSVKLGGTDLKSAPFVAPVPGTWSNYFGLSEEDVCKLSELGEKRTRG